MVMMTSYRTPVVVVVMMPTNDDHATMMVVMMVMILSNLDAIERFGRGLGGTGRIIGHKHSHCVRNRR